MKGFCWGGKYGDSQIRINHVLLALWDLNQLRNSPKTQMKGEGQFQIHYPIDKAPKGSWIGKNDWNLQPKVLTIVPQIQTLKLHFRSGRSGEQAFSQPETPRSIPDTTEKEPTKSELSDRLLKGYPAPWLAMLPSQQEEQENSALLEDKQDLKLQLILTKSMKRNGSKNQKFPSPVLKYNQQGSTIFKAFVPM